MGIEQDIAACDSRSAADLWSVYDSYSTQTDFADHIIALSSVQSCEKEATWLLKAWLEAGNTLLQSQLTEIYETLNRLQHWEAKLHVLQCIPFMPIAEGDIKILYKFLRLTLSDQNKFVRAWSYNGWYELSRQHPGYLEETRQYFKLAMRDEAPSVKARIRNILKKDLKLNALAIKQK